MLSSATLLRGLRTGSSCLQCKRYASHEAPQYNEPSGWLFGEKVGVHSIQCITDLKLISPPSLATPARSEKGERGLGESLVHRNVWHHGFCFCDPIL
jgi:hypothetical protein